MKEIAHGIPMTPQPAPVRPGQVRSGGGLILAMLFAFCAIGIHSDAYAAQSADVDELLSAVIASLEQGQPELRTGRGTAFVTETNRGVTTRKTVHFMFGEDCARSDVYLDRDGFRGDFELSWARNLQATVSLGDRSALVLSSRRVFGLYGYRRYDLCPESCVQLPCGSVVSALKFMAAQPATTVRIDDNGLLFVEYVLPEERGGTGIVRLALDSNNDYRLVEFLDSTRDLNGIGSEDEYSFVLTWKDYDGLPYVDSLRYRQRNKTVQEFGDPCEPYVSVFEKTVHVLDFEPNVEIDDNEFTLVGMNIANGVIVSDEVVGVVYNYGDDPAAELDLKLAVDEGLAQVDATIQVDPASSDTGADETWALTFSGTPGGRKSLPWPMFAYVGTAVVIIFGIFWRLRRRRENPWSGH